MLKRVLVHGQRLRVAIVGAGVAGLRAADILLTHGANVTIFEARSRLGGRLAQSEVLGHTVDLGPNWIHGNNEINPIVQLARQTDTATCSIGEEEALIYEDGAPVPKDDIAEIGEAFWSIISDAFKHSKEHSDIIPADKSLMDFIAERATERYAGEAEDVLQKKRTLLLQEAAMWGAFVGSPVTKQSLKFFWLEECIEGENPFVAGTYKKILEALSRPALEKANVRLETRVKGVTSPATDDGGVVVRLSGQEDEVFDEVIVTSPLGWLKRNKAIFMPPMPLRLSQAIDSIGYGTLDKVYITFPSAFWARPSSDSPTTSTPPAKPASLPNMTATTVPLHQPSSTSTPDAHTHPAFTHWLAPPTSPSEIDSPTIQALSLASLPKEHAHPTLLFYIFGSTSDTIADLVSTAPPESLESALIDFFHPYYSLLPNYNEDDPACTPTGTLATNWASDELAGYGSYSNFQVGLERGDEDIEVMRYGMPERRVWLAGEHTAPFVALGTVTGAYWAGEGVAQRILEVYGHVKK